MARIRKILLSIKKRNITKISRFVSEKSVNKYKIIHARRIQNYSFIKSAKNRFLEDSIMYIQNVFSFFQIGFGLGL